MDSKLVTLEGIQNFLNNLSEDSDISCSDSDERISIRSGFDSDINDDIFLNDVVVNSDLDNTVPCSSASTVPSCSK